MSRFFGHKSSLVKDSKDVKRSLKMGKDGKCLYLCFIPNKSELIAIDCDQTESAD